jgi:hypothetical protein
MYPRATFELETRSKVLMIQSAIWLTVGAEATT